MRRSIREFYRIIDNVKPPPLTSILEIGAGYGRLAFVFLSVFPNLKYTIVDISPARDVSSWYLTQLFPNRSINFLSPDQISRIPDGSVDVAINISSFDEMTLESVAQYFSEINRTARGGFFYAKQHKQSNKADNHYITQHQYPVPNSWKVLYRQQDALTNAFFEALYKVQ